jgi:DNA-binding CsgD family transcriptional regulator
LGAFVGRHDEVALLRAAVDALRRGRGGAVWVEGEPGIGKSALLAEGLAGARDGCEVAWGQADELTERFPHRVILDCLRIESRSTDPARAFVAATLRGEQSGGLLGSGDPALAVTEGLLDLVDHLCAQRPLVLVVDDLHWADDASLALWRKLAALVNQLPLLLVSSCRPTPRRDEVTDARITVVDGPGTLLALGPLAATEVGELVTELVGAPPGPTLRELAARATGNPLYVRELVDALRHEEAIRVENGLAEVPVGSGYEPPSTLGAAVSRRLGFLSPNARKMLQVAALLGPDFGIAELALVTGVMPAELAATVDEVVAAGIVVEIAVGRLAFRHPVIRQAFHDRTPATVRSALHRHLAQALAEAQAPVERVAAQLAATTSVDRWMVGWLSGSAVKLTSHAPRVAAELLQRAVDHTSVGDPRRDALLGGLTRISFRLGRDTEARRYARTVLVEAPDPALVAEARWLLAYMQGRAGEIEALDTLDQALADPAVPDVWQARLTALLGMAQGNFRGDLDLAESTAKSALARAEAAGDRFATGYALHCMAWLNGLRRDNARQAALIDKALRVLADDPEHVQLRLILHHNRMYALTVLDRIADAGTELAKARLLAERTGNVEMAGVIHVTAAVHYFWTGRWDDSLAELDAVPEHPINYMLLVSHGLKALLATRRDDRVAAARWLAAAQEQPISGAVERDNCHFLLAARATAAERNGDPAEALRALAVILEPEFAQMTLRYWLLPDVVRLALAVGDRERATTAVGICETEAVQEPTAGKAAAAGHCRGLMAGDAAPLLAAAGHYRKVGRTVELARVLDDAAVLLAAADHLDQARAAYTEAIRIYTDLNATWDVRRADSLIRPYGIRRGARGPRRRPTHGWNALSPTEIAVANLVARGLSNPDIATELLLSRRTVQSHVSHILSKLNAQSRIEIAREALRH